MRPAVGKPARGAYRQFEAATAWKRPTRLLGHADNEIIVLSVESSIANAAASSLDQTASQLRTPTSAAPLARRAGAGTGILWMLAATCLFVWQDSTARILVKTYPVPEVAFVRYFIHAALVGLVIAWRNPRLAISRRHLLQMARSSFLLAATLFVMLALRFMPLVDVSAIVWVAPVLVTALSGILLHERVTHAAWAGVIIGLIG